MWYFREVCDVDWTAAAFLGSQGRACLLDGFDVCMCEGYRGADDVECCPAVRCEELDETGGYETLAA